MILNTFYSIGADVMGMPSIQETGLCTNDDGTLRTLREYENEDLKLDRVRRRSGIIARSLTSVELRTKVIKDEQIGSFSNCIQVGRTQTQFFAPPQPLGRARGRMILRYSRTWLHLGT